MIHIKKMRILSTDGEQGAAKVLKKRFEFECSDINLFVGDQGCGKSTLLRMLQKNTDILPNLKDWGSEVTHKCVELLRRHQ